MIEIQNIGLTYSTVDPNIYEKFKSSGDAEIFEKLVQDLMINKYSDDKELTEYILSLPRHKQRMAILSLIDGDNVLWSKMNAYVNECSDKFEHVKDVVRIINQFVKDGEVEKKKFGEVMTPISLVKEMLDTLPKEVWSNPNLKWLDPANGAGTFPFVVIYKLMNGLKDWEPDVEKRYKHIVEKMIYVCELQNRNVFLWLCGVDPKDEYTTNTYWGSFLDEGFDKHMKEVWGVEKFDIVVGNPPYNGAETGGGNSLWDKFIRKSIPMIVDGGFLVYVHPSSWRKPPSKNSKTSDIWNLLTKENKLLYLEMHSAEDGMKTFGAGTRYDFYCMKRCDENQTTLVVDQNNNRLEIDLGEFQFLPNYNIDKINRLLGSGCRILFSRSAYGSDRPHVSDTKNDLFIHEVIHSITKNGPRIFYSSRRDRGLFNIPKVIFAESGLSDVIIDMEGRYGMTSHAFAIEVDNLEEALLLKKCLLSDEFKDIIKSCSWGNFAIDWRLFTYFRKDFYKFV